MISNKRYGVVAVEAAIVSSVFLLLIFGLLDLSLAVLRSNATEYSVNKLAREFSIEAAISSDDAPIALNTTSAAPQISKFIANGTPTIQLNRMNVVIAQSQVSANADNKISINIQLEHSAIVPALLPWHRLQIQSQSNHIVMPIDSVR